jgi:hypothetical protein
MSAVVHKALSEPAKFPAFLSASLDAIRADKGLSKNTLTALAMQMKGMSTDSIAFATVPLANPDYLVSIGGQQQSTVLWDQKSGDRLFQEIEDDKPIIQPPKPTPSASSTAKPAGLTVPPGQINVRVVNGVGIVGLAARAARDLHKVGFGTAVAPGARHGVTTTVIQYGPGRDDDQKSFQQTQGLLQAYPNLKGIVAPTTVGIAAAARYVSGSKYKGKVEVSGLGTPNQMRKFVKDGTVQKFELWNPGDLGYLASYAAAALASGQITGAQGEKFKAGKLGERTIGADGEVILGPPTVFDKNNIDNFHF